MASNHHAINQTDCHDNSHSGVHVMLEVFVVVIAIGLHKFLSDPNLVEAKVDHPHHKLFFWAGAFILVSLGVRYFLGSHVHAHKTYTKPLEGAYRCSFIKDLILRTSLAVWLVRVAVSCDFAEFVWGVMIFSGLGLIWSLTVPLFIRVCHIEGESGWGTWVVVDCLEVGVAWISLCVLKQNDAVPAVALTLAAVYATTFLVDVFRMTNRMT